MQSIKYLDTLSSQATESHTCMWLDRPTPCSSARSVDPLTSTPPRNTTPWIVAHILHLSHRHHIHANSFCSWLEVPPPALSTMLVGGPVGDRVKRWRDRWLEQSPRPISVQLAPSDTVLDWDAVPHILDSVISYASTDTLMTFRRVSRYTRHKADGILFDHIHLRYRSDRDVKLGLSRVHNRQLAVNLGLDDTPLLPQVYNTGSRYDTRAQWKTRGLFRPDDSARPNQSMVPFTNCRVIDIDGGFISHSSAPLLDTLYIIWCAWNSTIDWQPQQSPTLQPPPVVGVHGPAKGTVRLFPDSNGILTAFRVNWLPIAVSVAFAAPKSKTYRFKPGLGNSGIGDCTPICGRCVQHIVDGAVPFPPNRYAWSPSWGKCTRARPRQPSVNVYVVWTDTTPNTRRKRNSRSDDHDLVSSIFMAIAPFGAQYNQGDGSMLGQPGTAWVVFPQLRGDAFMAHQESLTNKMRQYLSDQVDLEKSGATVDQVLERLEYLTVQGYAARVGRQAASLELGEDKIGDLGLGGWPS